MPEIFSNRTGLCGFVAPGGVANGVGVGDGSGRLAAMIAGLVATRGDDAKAIGDTHTGIAACSGLEGADIAQEDGWTAAIQGRPTWCDTGLAEIARDRGDAQALLEVHRKLGADVLQHVSGAFSLAVVNGRAGYALIAVDRMGIEPMCWGQTPSGEFVFGSTASSVRAWPGIDCEMLRQAVYDFLYYYFVPSPQTIFQGVVKLSPGNCVVFEGGKAHQQTYWRMPYHALGSDDGEISPAAMQDGLLQGLRQGLTSAVGRAAEGLDANRTGVFLSGGLDSSSVAGLVKQATGNLKTFTIGFAEQDYDETPYARLSAEHFGAEHHEYFVTAEDAAEALPEIAAAYDEPFANSSAIPTYFCAKFAAEHGIKTLLAGDGGDELFGGNERYTAMGRFDVYGKIPAPLRKLLLDPVLGLPFWSGVPIASKAQNLMRRYYMPLARRMYSYNPFCDLRADQVLMPEFLKDIEADGPLHVMERALERHPSTDNLQTMMGLDLTLTLADNDLRKVGRMCQLAGIGVRFPFLDDELVSLAAGMPSALLMPDGQLRGFFKQAMTGFLHPDTLTKKKHGFGLPTESWARNAPVMRDLIVSKLIDFGQRGIAREDFVERLVRSCDAGSADPIVSSAYDLAMLEMWLASHGPV